MNDHRRYDFGLRGPPEGRGAGPRPRAGRGALEHRHDRRAAPRMPRVTASYNRDYVAYDRGYRYGGRGRDDYPRNYNPYAGDRPDQIGDPRGYRRPYTTIGGTRTFRGSPDDPRSR